MNATSWFRLLAAAGMMAAASSTFAAPAAPPSGQEELRNQMQQDFNQGNFKDAYEGFRKLTLEAQPGAVSPRLVGNDLGMALQCLQRLNRADEIDALLEDAVKVHKANWRLLWSAAQDYLSPGVPHYGFIVAGKFYRGQHRGGGRMVNATERDRIRALQLMVQAMPLAMGDENHAEVGDYLQSLAGMLLGNRGYGEAWRLQYLSDLNVLPDYQEGGGWGRGWGRGQQTPGAPVDADGHPVFHHVPKSFEAAKTDGERWRWCLQQAAEMDPRQLNPVRMQFAEFLLGQFGVQTMAQWGWRFGRMETDDTKENESGTYALHTLKEDETIAKLAVGIKRFELPDEFNYIKIFQEVAAKPQAAEAVAALEQLAQIFENRRQYPRAADYWRRLLSDFPSEQPNRRKGWQQRLAQIVDNWGRFEPNQTQPAGRGATLEYRFRNGNRVECTAQPINVVKLLADINAYLKSNPRQLDWNKFNLGNLGYRLVEQNEKQYLGPEIARWQLPLDPRPDHFDKRVTVTTPLQKPGAYLVRATMAGGNTCFVIVWVDDMAILKKPLPGKTYYFVADAVTGRPIPKANVEFFGWQQIWHNNPPHAEVVTKDFAELTDADGQVIPDPQQQAQGFQWLITARTPEGRFAYLGFTGIWYGNWYDAEYNATKVFTITDRPVYRPEQKVHYKFWVRHAKYDMEDGSEFAGREFTVEFRNPKGDKIVSERRKTDAYGGIEGEYSIPADATLGVYGMAVNEPGTENQLGGGSFRVEEYKKPEFEVTIDAPDKPVMLGEKITATIRAKYYFGSPVINAKVKYKINRTSYAERWYPVRPWDWLYGPGYWWFGCDYNWYPGWRHWGCPRPMPFWWPHQTEPPELVAEQEVPIGPDGTVKVEIDTAVAKAIHPDQDHSYSITAEVVDQSRRTIVGAGNVLVARRPFTVYAWLDRGYFRMGDTIDAHFSARTLDGRPVEGSGELRLLRISYEHGKPVETPVQLWHLNTNAEGVANQPLAVSQSGQYRLSYKLTDSKEHTIEGGYVFTIIGEGFDGSQFRFNHLELVPEKQSYAPGDVVRLQINTDRTGGTVLLFARPANGIYLPPKVIHLDGKSTVEEIGVVKKDMPNFFIEADTIADGRVYTEMKEIVVPPEKRVLNVEIQPSKEAYRPGEKAKVKLKLTDFDGRPFVGSTVVAIYDKSVEYISGGSNVPEIKAFFWKWRRQHNPQTESSLGRWFGCLIPRNTIGMNDIGVFGGTEVEENGESVDEETVMRYLERGRGVSGGLQGGFGGRGPQNRLMKSAVEGANGLMFDRAAAAPMAAARGPMVAMEQAAGKGGGPAGAAPLVQPTIRTKFADTALWVGALTTAEDGTAEVGLDMPENLTTWRIKVWGMGAGTRVGEGFADVVTRKDLIIRLEAPRFFVQNDIVVLSAIVHNYLKTKKKVSVELDLEGELLAPIGIDSTASVTMRIDPDQRLASVAEMVERITKAAGVELEDPVWAKKLRVSKAVKVATTGRPGFEISQPVEVNPSGEARVDWLVQVRDEGQATIRVKALTDEESDAMEQKFPCYIHGMLKMDSTSGSIRPKDETGKFTVTVPEQRRPKESRLEVRYSPTLAGAMVDALPYMVDYPYGCTEQTLNRFLPTVITQKILLNMHLDLGEIQKKRTNLNAQEIGDDKERAAQWKRYKRNPVFDEDEVRRMVKQGVERLTEMQCSDGGWGWFSGWGEHSDPHTTALVVHGLQLAKQNDVALVPGVLERGVEWLTRYQDGQVQLIKNAAIKDKPPALRWKEYADNLDAFVYMVLVDAGVKNADMLEFLYRDRTHLAVYGMAMYGLALEKQLPSPAGRGAGGEGGVSDKLAMILRNIGQYVEQDDENQTAWLRLPEGFWWCWYGSEYEAHAYYLKLLARTDPKGELARRIVKYLLNNRKNATYWNSTRDTALCIEAMADFIRASGEDRPEMTVEVYYDGKLQKAVEITPKTLFMFDNKFVLEGDALSAGQHTIELRKKGAGPLYFNGYLSTFTLEDFIKRAGLEIKVNRKYYKLVEAQKSVHAAGSRGQAVEQRVEKYERQELPNDAVLKSGDLVEIELEIDSKNDYEYLVFEDMKPSGFEPVDLRSGYTGNDLGAYVEFRDNRVVFFARAVARGKHSVSYRMRAEIPGRFSALPTRGWAMYAPELKANSDELKIGVKD